MKYTHDYVIFVIILLFLLLDTYVLPIFLMVTSLAQKQAF